MSGPAGPTKKDAEEVSESSGLPQPELRYLAIGQVTRAHGLHGELSVAVLTEFPARFETTERVYVGNEFEAVPYRLVSYRWHKKNILLTLEGITTRTEAEQLRGQFVQVPLEEAMPLPLGSYYLYQLMGLQVITTEDEVLGTLVDVMETGANNVYVVKGNDQTILLPAISDVVKEVDLKKGQMVIKLLDGLI